MFLFSFSCVRIPQLCGPNIRHVHIRQFEKDKGEKKGNSWFSPYLSWRISSFPSPLFLAFPLLSSFPFGLLTLLPALHSPKKRRREGDNGDEKGSQGGEWKEMKPATPYKSGFFFSSPPVLSRGQRFVPRSEVARRRGAPMRLSWKRDGCLTFKVFFLFHSPDRPGEPGQAPRGSPSSRSHPGAFSATPGGSDYYHRFARCSSRSEGYTQTKS